MKKEISSIIENSITSAETIGANCVVIKDEQEIYSSCFGYADKENNIPMDNDTIFRLFSLSKPITAVAAMILIDKGIISYSDPVSKYIPEFKYLSYVSETDEILPCTETMLVSHLLNMTSGLPYPNNWGTSVKACGKLFDEIIKDQNENNELTTLEICRKAADIPLLFQPGENWEYGISADILAGVVEAASGIKYSDFLKKYIFEPLRMTDTDFYVPSKKLNRFSALYSWQGNKLTRDNNNYLGISDYTCPPAFESGGAGLVSTINDYSKFAMMLAGKGVYKGIRLFSEKTADFMITPHLSTKQANSLWDRLAGYNYGSLMRILENPEIAEVRTCKGEIGWDGWTGTFLLADPVNHLVCLYFTQIAGAGTTKQAQQICKVIYDKLIS